MKTERNMSDCSGSPLHRDGIAGQRQGHLDQVSQLGCHHRAERYIHAEGDAAHADGGGYPK